MEEETPVKRRRTENLNDISRNVEVNRVSVKPDKIQKLRRIAASCTEKIQVPKYDDIVVISSVGSSPSSSPRPERLTALSNPVDPAELHARLKVLVQDEDKENRAVESGDGTLQAGNEVVRKGVNISLGKLSETDDVNDKRHSTANVVPDKNMNIPMSGEEFRVLLCKTIDEKMKKLEQYYTESVIPDLEKKIADLESDNERLKESARQLQDSMAKAVEEHKKQEEKPVQCHVGVQACSSEPPPLTPVTTTVLSMTSPGKPPVVHIIDSVQGVHKPPSTSVPQVTQVSTVNTEVSLRAVSIANGIRHTSVNTGGHVYTTMSGQPRMYSDAPYQPGSHPNAVVAPRSHAPFARPPSGAITATVYPQPQNLPTPPSTLGVHRISPPTPPNPSPPNRFQYNPQMPNGITIRTRAQVVTNSAAQYVVGAERDNPAVIGAQLGIRHRLPPAQGLPPSYSVATARPQQPVVYNPAAAPNTVQVNGVRHYGVRQNAPPPVPTQVTPIRAAGPPPLVRAQPNIHQQRQNSYPGPHINQRPPYPQNPPTQVVNNPNQIRIQQAAAVTPRHHVAPASAPPPPSQSSPAQNITSNGIVRDRTPPTPTVSISGASNGIVLSWNMTIPEGCAPIDSYQLFAYQNSGHAANSPSLWKKLGIVKALPLPMACTLTQFVSGSIYYFAVRAIDVHGRAGNYSAPCAITLPNESDKGRT